MGKAPTIEPQYVAPFTRVAQLASAVLVVLYLVAWIIAPILLALRSPVPSDSEVARAITFRILAGGLGLGAATGLAFALSRLSRNRRSLYFHILLAILTAGLFVFSAILRAPLHATDI